MVRSAAVQLSSDSVILKKVEDPEKQEQQQSTIKNALIRINKGITMNYKINCKPLTLVWLFHRFGAQRGAIAQFGLCSNATNIGMQMMTMMIMTTMIMVIIIAHSSVSGEVD